jgi:hypothetical protein
VSELPSSGDLDPYPRTDAPTRSTPSTGKSPILSGHDVDCQHSCGYILGVRSTLRLIALILSFLSGFGMATFLFNLPGEPAAALAPCLDGNDYANKGGLETSSQHQFLNTGTRANMLVETGGVSCQHISSIYVGSKTGSGYAEFGWIRGWSRCEADGADDTKYTTATLFRWFRTTNGLSNCRVYQSRTPSPGLHYFEVSNRNADNVWYAYIDFDLVQGSGISLDWQKGLSYVAMERGNQNDPGGAEWKNLSRHRGGAWDPWDSHTRLQTSFGPGGYIIWSSKHSEAVS